MTPRIHSIQTEGVRLAMGTLLHVALGGSDPQSLEAARDRAFKKVHRLEDLLSRFRPESDIRRIAAQSASGAVRVAAATFQALDQALQIARLSGGAFDPTLGFYEDVEMDESAQSIRLLRPGMTLDLGAFGKGFALDQALEAVIADPSIDSVRFDFGGQLLFWSQEGNREEHVCLDAPGTAWHGHRFTVRGNRSVSTSFTSERGRHIIDPRTGQPVVRHVPVSLIAATAGAADAWSTAVFVLGLEAARPLIQIHDVECVQERGERFHPPIHIQSPIALQLCQMWAKQRISVGF